jgi:alpha-L-rhamnosidase
VYFNQLRMGEYYDARIGEFWRQPEYDDNDWGYAIPDPTPPEGVFRACPCEPIREMRRFTPVRIVQNGVNSWLYDFGQNISGKLLFCNSGF